MAADHDDPAKYTEKLVQLFLNIKSSHTPHDRSWSRLPYDGKDKHALKLETGAVKEMDLDNVEPPAPIQATPWKQRASVAIRSRDYPKQNLVDSQFPKYSEGLVC
jgi:hypothetical protein